MNRRALTSSRTDRRHRGFTIIEMVTTLLVLGTLIAISIPNYTGYKLKAQYAALEEYVDIIMDAQDLYLTEHGHFYPENGTLNIPSRTQWSSPELDVSLPEDHLHSFRIYSVNRENRRFRFNYLYLIVDADIDFDRNGRTDSFMVLTYFRDDRPIHERKLIRYR